MGSRTERRPSLRGRLRRTAELVRVLGPRDLRIRYRQSTLHGLWAIIGPLATLGVYGIVLTQAFGVTTTCGPYISSAWTGLVIWTFFATAVAGGVTSLVQASDLIKKLYFPREALPLAAVAASFAELAVGFVSAVVLATVLGRAPGLMALWVVAPLAVVVMWTCAISIMASVLAAFSRDVVHGVNVALRVGFFATAVMYEAGQVPPPLRWTVRLNPLSVSITEMRNNLLCNTGPSPRLLSIHLVVAGAALVAAVLYTRAVESRLADVV